LHKITSLIIIGGFEAMTALTLLQSHRASFPSFNIPCVHIPATISNNIPGTDVSLGTDTSLNAIVNAIDVLKQSATASRRRIFIVETHGNFCGYLATVGALASGGDVSYTWEEGINLQRIMSDLEHFRRRFDDVRFGDNVHVGL
jgi:6-phosphofructokinase 1